MSAQQVIDTLQREVPGLTAERHIPPHAVDGVSVRYKCPCGEISGISLCTSALIDEFTAPLIAKQIKRDLREHVLSEGNQPDF